MLLASDVGVAFPEMSWQNPTNQFDVNDDSHVSYADLAHILNEINYGGGSRKLATTASGSGSCARNSTVVEVGPGCRQ